MRDVDGLLPLEAFDELLKFMFFKSCAESGADSGLRNAKPGIEASATAVRRSFASYLRARAPWARDLWPEEQFRVSDPTLDYLGQLFTGTRFAELDFDIRAAALSSFLGAEMRKSLGIFSTPDDVARAMVEFVAPDANDSILDPACGTGTFLIQAARHQSSTFGNSTTPTLMGIDKNPRMLLIACLNLENDSTLRFKKACTDSLRMFESRDAGPFGITPNSVDVILTNPPFGTKLSPRSDALRLAPFQIHSDHFPRGPVPSELLFLECCLNLLKPGGRLGIVLPRSVLTNDSLQDWRKSIDRVSHLTEIIDLPPETFAPTGVQTNTVAAIFRKHTCREQRTRVNVLVAHVTNVGYDATGRANSGNQLRALDLSNRVDDTGVPVRINKFSGVLSNSTMQRAADWLFERHGSREGHRLSDFVDLANTGRTPSRHAYADDGGFILKVGNLTGRGIDWTPRLRNFVSPPDASKRSRNQSLQLLDGDIVLTSSAHNPSYIAKKVDIIWKSRLLHDQLTFVGELMRLRPKSNIDPFLLLAALRIPTVQADLRARVRGQTAHLKPDDLLRVTIPFNLCDPPTGDLAKLAGLLREEAELAFQLGRASRKAAEILASSCAAGV